MIETIQNAVILTTKLSLFRRRSMFYISPTKSTNACCLLETWQQRSEYRNYDTTVTAAVCWERANTHIYSPGRAVKAWVWQTEKSQASDQKEVLVIVGLWLCSPLLEFTGEWVFKVSAVCCLLQKYLWVQLAEMILFHCWGARGDRGVLW